MEYLTQTSGPRTTATSNAEGRLKVDAGSTKKKKEVMKKVIGKYKSKMNC